MQALSVVHAEIIKMLIEVGNNSLDCKVMKSAVGCGVILKTVTFLYQKPYRKGGSMRELCEKCKYSKIDYIWDEEIQEEYPIYICKKGHDTELIVECEDFKKYRPRKYKEQDTKCDKCEYLEECKSKHEVIDCTSELDTKRHYIVDLGVICKMMLKE